MCALGNHYPTIEPSSPSRRLLMRWGRLMLTFIGGDALVSIWVATSLSERRCSLITPEFTQIRNLLTGG